ncbi:MAG: methyl-accepting chemotaxis protein [Muricomes sp.]
MNFKKMKLATKTSLIIAVILTVLLAALITATVLTVRARMFKTIDSEFSGIASENGIIVQNIMDDAASVAQNLQGYLDNTYVEYEEMLDNQGESEDGSKIPFPVKRSEVYDADIIEVSYEAESYILHNAWNIVKNNSDIIGIGAYFEPYAFDDSVKDYSLYVSEEGAENETAEIAVPYEEYANMEWYSMAATTQKPYFTKPYVEDDITMVTVSYPIVSEGKTQGVILVDIDVDNFAKVKSADEKYPTMFTDILTQEGVIVYDSDSKEFVGQNLTDLLGDDITGQILEKAKAGTAFQIEANYSGDPLMEYYYPIQAGEEIWWSSTALAKSDLNKVVVSLSLLMIGMAVFALVLLIVVVVLLLKRMLKPINHVVSVAEKIVKGELDVHVEVESEDEIGILSRAFENMSDNLRLIISEVGYLLGEMAKGNFRVRTRHEEVYIGEYRNILLAMRSINTNLSSTLMEINAAANQVSAGSDQIAGSAQALSQGAAEQASSVEELSATLLEISRRITENAESAVMAGQVSAETEASMQESNDNMEELRTAMSHITDTSAEISKIIKTIDDIAFQTNILALNAAVEAARAGSAGKGFAVVADEVRSLAGKCSEAAKHTTELIESTVLAVENGMKQTEATAESLGAVVEKAAAVDKTIQQIAQASEEQSQAITQLTAGVEQISAVVQTNSATAEESAAASEELSGQAQMLKNLVEGFELKDVGAPAGAVLAPEVNKKEKGASLTDSGRSMGKY